MGDSTQPAPLKQKWQAVLTEWEIGVNCTCLVARLLTQKARALWCTRAFE